MAGHKRDNRRAAVLLGLLLSGYAPAAAAATTLASTSTTAASIDPELCAAAPNAYYRPLLAGPPTACPVPLGRGGARQHRWLAKRGQTAASLVDDPSKNPADPGNWHPWTHPPVCGNRSSYCVYTQADLPASGGVGGDLAASENSAQGLSILTTPEMAAHLLHPHEFALRPHALERAASAFAYEEGKTVRALTPPSFDVRPVTGKGRGAVATRNIRAGDAVLVDRPVLLAHYRRLTDEEAAEFGTREDDHGLGREAPQDRHRLWQVAVDRLPPAVGKCIREEMHVVPQYNVTKKPIPKPGSKARPLYSHEENVFASNAFPLVLKGYAFKALFPNAVVFNHDCRPNLVAQISEVPLTMVVYSTRDIESGEELTLSYLPDLLPHAQRQRLFRRRWGFDCQCSLCKDTDPSELAASDSRRMELYELPTRLQRFVDAGDLGEALAVALEARDLFAQEGVLRATGEDENETVKGAMADPFGPEGFAETLGGLYAATGKWERALPQLRAALAERKWRAGGWPTEEEAAQMVVLAKQVATLEVLEVNYS